MKDKGINMVAAFVTVFDTNLNVETPFSFPGHEGLAQFDFGMTLKT